MNISGIMDAAFQKIKDSITVGQIPPGVRSGRGTIKVRARSLAVLSLTGLMRWQMALFRGEKLD